MDFRTAIIVPIRAGGGSFWIFLGLLVIGWMIWTSGPDYISAEQAEREISVRFRKNDNRHLSPRPQPGDELLYPRFRQPNDWSHRVMVPVVPMIPVQYVGVEHRAIAEMVLDIAPDDSTTETTG